MRDYSWLWAWKATAITKCFYMIHLLDTSVNFCLRACFSQPSGKLFWGQKGYRDGILIREELFLSWLKTKKLCAVFIASLSSYTTEVLWKIILHSYSQSSLFFFSLVLSGVLSSASWIILRFWSYRKTKENIWLDIYSDSWEQKKEERQMGQWQWALVLSQGIQWPQNQKNLDIRFRLPGGRKKKRKEKEKTKNKKLSSNIQEEKRGCAHSPHGTLCLLLVSSLIWALWALPKQSPALPSEAFS